MEDLFKDFLKNIPERFCNKCMKCEQCGRCGSSYNAFGKFIKSPWQELPEGCGYEGWLFQKREELKKHVRKYKEERLSLQVMLLDSDLVESQKIKEKIEEIEKVINLFEKYGSKIW